MAMRALWSGVSGMQAHQVKIDVIGDNIANLNTVGFKRSEANFSSFLSQMTSIPLAPTGSRGGINGQQIGLGVKVASIMQNHTQGQLQRTDRKLDLAIEGNGFYTLDNASTGGQVYTRAGAFSLDSDGNLIDPATGNKVMGWNAAIDSATNNYVINSGSSPIEDIKINVGQVMEAKATDTLTLEGNLDAGQSYAIDPITVSFSNGSSTTTDSEININFEHIWPGDNRKLFRWYATWAKNPPDGNKVGDEVIDKLTGKTAEGIVELNSAGEVIGSYINTSSSNVVNASVPETTVLDANGVEVANGKALMTLKEIFARNQVNGFEGDWTISFTGDGKITASVPSRTSDSTGSADLSGISIAVANNEITTSHNNPSGQWQIKFSTAGAVGGSQSYTVIDPDGNTLNAGSVASGFSQKFYIDAAGDTGATRSIVDNATGDTIFTIPTGNFTGTTAVDDVIEFNIYMDSFQYQMTYQEKDGTTSGTVTNELDSTVYGWTGENFVSNRGGATDDDRGEITIAASAWDIPDYVEFAKSVRTGTVKVDFETRRADVTGERDAIINQTTELPKNGGIKVANVSNVNQSYLAGGNSSTLSGITIDSGTYLAQNSPEGRWQITLTATGAVSGAVTYRIYDPDGQEVTSTATPGTGESTKFAFSDGDGDGNAETNEDVKIIDRDTGNLLFTIPSSKWSGTANSGDIWNFNINLVEISEDSVPMYKVSLPQVSSSNSGTGDLEAVEVVNFQDGAMNLDTSKLFGEWTINITNDSGDYQVVGPDGTKYNDVDNPLKITANANISKDVLISLEDATGSADVGFPVLHIPAKNWTDTGVKSGDSFTFVVDSSYALENDQKYFVVEDADANNTAIFLPRADGYKEKLTFTPNTTTNITLNDPNIDSSKTNAIATGGTPSTASLNDLNDYQYQTSVKVYDSQGTAHDITFRFEKVSTSLWMWSVLDPTPTDPNNVKLAGYGLIPFKADGTVDTGLLYTSVSQVGEELAQELGETINSTTISGYQKIIFDPDGTGASTPTENGADRVSITPDFSKMFQFSGSNSAQITDQNGYAAGTLIDYGVGMSGVISGFFDNGQTRDVAQIALAFFSNPSGLLKEGDTMWSESANSGMAMIGTPGSSGRGTIVSGSLESSNVDLAMEFTELIVTQRGFQANSRTITTADQLLQELLRLRS